MVAYAKVKRHHPDIYDKDSKFYQNDMPLKIPTKPKEKKYTIKE